MGQVQRHEVRLRPEDVRDAPLQPVPAQVEDAKSRVAQQRRWYLPRDGVAVQVQRRQHRHLPQLLRDPTADPVHRQIKVGQPVYGRDRARDCPRELVPGQQRPAQHRELPDVGRDLARDPVVPEVEVHEARHLEDRRRDLAREVVVGKVEDRGLAEVPDSIRDTAGEPVADQVEDPEGGQGGDAVGDLAGDALPVGNDECGEVVELADGGADGASHAPGSAGLQEDGVLGLAAEVDVGDPLVGGVAADTVPVAAAVIAGPRVEDTKVGLVEGGLEAQQSHPVRRRAALDDRRYRHDHDEGCRREEKNKQRPAHHLCVLRSTTQ